MLSTSPLCKRKNAISASRFQQALSEKAIDCAKPVPTQAYSLCSYDSAYGVLINPYYFTGRRLDTESNLYFFRARYFDADLGRFIARDMLDSGNPRGGYHDGYGLYNGYFIPNNTDPSGLKVCPCTPPLNATYGAKMYNSRVVITSKFIKATVRDNCVCLVGKYCTAEFVKTYTREYNVVTVMLSGGGAKFPLKRKWVATASCSCTYINEGCCDS